MKRLILCLALLVPVACAPKHFENPQAKAAYTADQVVTRLGEFQKVVIDAQQAGKVPLDTARVIVTWVSGDTNAVPPALGAVDIVKTTPTGWKATLQTGWAAVRTRLLAVIDLSPWVSILDPLIEGVTQ